MPDNILKDLREAVYAKKSELYYELQKLRNTISGGTGGIISGLETKSGYIPATSFTGTPKTYQVIFNTSFSSNYSISIISEDARIWTYENKTLLGFTLNSNSYTDLNNDVYWQSILIGEF